MDCRHSAGFNPFDGQMAGWIFSATTLFSYSPCNGDQVCCIILEKLLLSKQLELNLLACVQEPETVPHCPSVWQVDEGLPT